MVAQTPALNINSGAQMHRIKDTKFFSPSNHIYKIEKGKNYLEFPSLPLSYFKGTSLSVITFLIALKF